MDIVINNDLINSLIQIFENLLDISNDVVGWLFTPLPLIDAFGNFNTPISLFFGGGLVIYLTYIVVKFIVPIL